MSTTSEDIQAAGSDTLPPMLDRTDYEPFRMGKFRKKLGVTVEGDVIFEPEQPRTYADRDYNEQERYMAYFRATHFMLQGLPKDIYMLVNHIIEAKVIWDYVKMLLSDSRLKKVDCTRHENNEVPVVLTDVSSVLYDESLATELAIYKE
ncbi:hypothetical protein Tco_0585612 [Tanacetum coccineum]